MLSSATTQSVGRTAAEILAGIRGSSPSSVTQQAQAAPAATGFNALDPSGLQHTPAPQGLEGPTGAVALNRGVEDAGEVLIGGLINMAKDVGNYARNLPGITSAFVRDLANPASFGPNASSPTIDAFIASHPTEEIRSTLRGAALTSGTVSGSVAGSIVRSTGARILQQGAAARAAPSVVAAQIGASSGAAEGLAFAATFGPLHQYAEEGRVSSDRFLADATLFTLFGGVLGAGGGYFTATRGAPRPEVVAEAHTAFRQAAAETLPVVQRSRLPMPPEPQTAEELVAQVAAGVTEQSPSRIGIFGQASGFGRSILDALQTRFPAVRSLDISTHERLLAAATSRDLGAYLGVRAAQAIEAGLTQQERSILWRGLIAARGRQIRRDLIAQAEQIATTGENVAVNGKLYDAEGLQRLAASVRIGELPEAERLLFESSPVIRGAVQRYQENILPLITEVRTRNGLRSFVETDEPFLPLIGATEEQVLAGIEVLRTEGVGSTTGAIGKEVYAETTPGAMRALGQGRAYIADGQALFTQLFSREFSIDRKNELLANIINAPWARKLAPGERATGKVKIGNTEYRLVELEVRGNPQVLSNRFGIQGIETVTLPAEPAALGAGRLALPAGEAPTASIGAGQSTALVRRNAITLHEGEFASLEGILEDAVLPGEVGETVLGRYAVPQPVRRAYREIFDPDFRRGENLRMTDVGNPIVQSYFKFMDTAVGMLLATSVEVAAHSARELSRLASIPGVGTERGALQRLANKFGGWFGTRLGAMRDIYSVYSPATLAEDLATEALLAKVPGGIPSRAFESEFQSGVQSIVGRTFGPRASHAMEAGRKFLFNLPTQAPGLRGFDIRARIAATKALRRMTRADLGREPTISELSEFLQQFGSYTEGIQSNLQSFLRRNRINPFAANISTITSEVRSFFGGTNLPASIREEMTTAMVARYQGEVLWRMTFGTAMTALLVQKALTDSWPWENEPGHKEDLRVGYTSDGRAVYVPITSFEPDLGRAARIVGARAFMEAFGDEGEVGARTALRDLANTGITYTIGGAPGIGALQTLALGGPMYFTDEGQTLQIVPPQPTDALTIKERFLYAAGEANPTLEQIFGVGHAGDNPTSIRIINALTPGMKVGRAPLLRVSAELRGDRARLYEIARDRVNAAHEESPSPLARQEIYLREAATFPPEQRTAALQAMLQLDAQTTASRYRSASEAILRP